MIDPGMSEDQITEMVREDWRSARQTREQQLDEAKLRLLRLYRGFRSELAEGGKGKDAKGPFGWSKVSANIPFWIVETILPRVGINIPTVTVTAQNPMAVNFAQAKQMRTQQQWKMSRIEEQLMLAIKSMLILGEGVMKDFWDPVIGGPSSLYVPWFDFFISTEAQQWYTAEYLCHRTWHTRRGIEGLVKRDSERRDRHGNKLAPLYDHEALEQVLSGSSTREAGDSSWAAVREMAEIGPAMFPNSEGQIALVEVHYADGCMAVIAGDDQPILVRHEREPLYTDPKGRAFRPFTVLANTPDILLPYSISSVAMLEDIEHEATTLTNQSIDQATRNINQMTGIDETAVDAAQVIAAKGVPGGVFTTKGPPGQAVQQYPAGQLSQDFERIQQELRQRAQLMSGVSDVATATQTAGGINNDTATGASILAEEANARWRFLLKLIGLGMNRMAQHFDWMDRQIGTTPVSVPLGQGDAIEPGARGITPVGDKFARIGTEVNAAGLDYLVEVDAGSLAPPSQMQQAQNTRALISDLLMLQGFAAIPPGMVNIDVGALARVIIESHGQSAETILLPAPPPAPPMQVGPDGQPLAGPQGLAPPPGPAGPPAPPGPPQLAPPVAA